MPTASPLIPRHFDHVIYHAGCVDGFTSAWLLHKRCPDAQIHEGRYGEAPPEGMTGHVVIADFSYDVETISHMLAAAGPRNLSITILDHHQTAVENLEGCEWTGVELILDQDHSGAALVADWLGVLGPDRALAAYVEDRDLWRFALPHSREIVAYINAVPFTFEGFDGLSADLARDHDLVCERGHAIGMRNRLLIDWMVKNTARRILFDAPSLDPDSLVPILTTPSPYPLGSDVAGELAKIAGQGDGCEPTLAAYYIDYPNRREFGLRSTEDGPDVAKIAEHYGGGGHNHASGFRVVRGSGHPLLTA